MQCLECTQPKQFAIVYNKDMEGKVTQTSTNQFLILFTFNFNLSLILFIMQSNFQTDSFDQAIAISINSFHRYSQFDLDSYFRAIAFPFVFVFVCYSELIDILSTCNFNLPEFKTPAIAINPLFIINEQFQSVTVKNIRKMQSFPKSYKKQDMINALLITY